MANTGTFRMGIRGHTPIFSSPNQITHDLGWTESLIPSSSTGFWRLLYACAMHSNGVLSRGLGPVAAFHIDVSAFSCNGGWEITGGKLFSGFP